jgi:hypothetical protein
VNDSQFGKSMVKLGYDKVKSNRVYYRNVVVRQVVELSSES